MSKKNDFYASVPIGTLTDICEASKSKDTRISELEKAVEVLAHDKVHGIADMIGAKVLANPIALAAVEKAKESRP